ncbi:unnamed protein product [Meganyctiphanes norvegica]|uniref:Uncharacterized protein n=1 Tax=Meganyctiphanes norvegica TaxID=48144 RepID=A0AAV2Q5K5_MEGNR
MVTSRATTASAALVLVALVVVVHQAAAGVRNTQQGPGRGANRGGILYGQSRNGESSWAACKEPVCQEVGSQAEGLLRLKDLRNYIVETMRLMDSLVTSVDAELVNQGADIAKFVGPLCRNSHEMLLNISTPSANANLEMGVNGPLSQNVDRFTTQNTEPTGSKTSGRRQAKLDSMWEQDAEQGEFDQETSESRVHVTYSTSDSSSNKIRPSGSDGRQQRPVDGTSHQYGPHGSTGIVTNAGIPSTSGGGGGGGYGGANTVSGGGSGKGRAVTYTGFGSGGNGGRVVDSSGCKGVERGSTHWVPGLDGWCATNCPTGYCPETHCVCS